MPGRWDGCPELCCQSRCEGEPHDLQRDLAPSFLQAASPLVFPSSRHRAKAVCAVEVAPRPAQRGQLFTFCLERVEQGPLRNCWLTVGVRVGDYANS